jgi:hypothetical protein
MKNDVKKFLKNLCILCTIIFLLDRSLGFVMQYFYEKQTQGETAITTYAIEKAKEDIIIFGSSRASHHYDCRIFRDSLGLSAFNTGKDGMSIIYASTILPLIIERHKPKLIFLDVNPEELSFRAGKEGQDLLISTLLPYASRYRKIRETISENNKIELIKSQISKLYAYNSFIIPIIQHYMHIGLTNFNGYVPLSGSHTSVGETSIVQKNHLVIDSFILKKFEDFLSQVKAANVNMKIIISPILMHNSTVQVAIMQSLANKYGYDFWDYSQAINDPKLFYDNLHLNAQGAVAFSKLIVTRFKREIQ